MKKEELKKMFDESIALTNYLCRGYSNERFREGIARDLVLFLFSERLKNGSIIEELHLRKCSKCNLETYLSDFCTPKYTIRDICEKCLNDFLQERKDKEGDESES